VNPRIESAALISHKLETRVSPVLGINPESENNMTGLKKRLIKGSYLENNSNAVLITEGLAERLKVDVGDSIILFGQGYQGVTAAEQLAIQGIIRFPLPKMNNAMVFLSLSKAQQLYNAYNRLTSISLMINDVSHMKILQSELKNKIDTSLTVMNWEEMSPEIVQSIEADSASGVIMLLIFYIVIGFGVFGTIMMMTIERSREFGLLIALGMRRERMYILTVLESLFVSMTGAIAGIAISFPVLLYLYYNPIPLTGDLAKIYLAYGMEPIFPFSVNPGIFYSQAIVVFVIGIVTSLYPLFVIRKLKPVSALQGRGGVK
jgi:ABC-type lipoprotein release transport system permease subunit